MSCSTTRRSALVLLRGLLPRLETFLEPFVGSLCCCEQRTNAHHYVSGLLSDLKSKDAESIAYLHDRERQGLQKFIGQAPWDHKPLIAELARQVGQRLGQADGVLVFDPSAFVKQGKKSVGVAAPVVRPAGQGRELPGRRLPRLRLATKATPWSIPASTCPRSGPRTANAARRPACPRRSASPPGTSWPSQMLDEQGGLLPHRWVAGDDEMGRSSWFRQQLRQRGERYLLAVPSNTLVRDLVPPTRRTPGRAGASGRRSCARTCGARLWPRTTGRRSRCATGRRGRC